MPTLIQTLNGTVTGLWGSAMVRTADGRLRVLKLGDFVSKGDVILTTQDGIVQLEPNDEAAATALASGSAVAGSDTPTAAAAQSTPELDRVIAELNQPASEEAPAAGLAGGDGGTGLTPGLRVDRIAESTTTTGFNQI